MRQVHEQDIGQAEDESRGIEVAARRQPVAGAQALPIFGEAPYLRAAQDAWIMSDDHRRSARQDAATITSPPFQPAIRRSGDRGLAMDYSIISTASGYPMAAICFSNR